MTGKRFDELIKECQEIEGKILSGKGKEYSEGNDDRLHNFKMIAQMLKLDPMKVWFVYFYKHISSIVSFINNNCEFSDEVIDGRVSDARNYLLLFQGLVEDLKNETIKKDTIIEFKIPNEIKEAAAKIREFGFDIMVTEKSVTEERSLDDLEVETEEIE